MREAGHGLHTVKSSSPSSYVKKVGSALIDPASYILQS